MITTYVIPSSLCDQDQMWLSGVHVTSRGPDITSCSEAIYNAICIVPRSQGW